MNSEKIIKILNSINEHMNKYQNCAYYELLVQDVYGEFNEENEIKLSEDITLLKELDLIKVNGDRIALNNSIKFMIAESDTDVKKIFSNEDGVTIKNIDIGHGANCMAQVVEFVLQNPQLVQAIEIGTFLYSVSLAYKGYKIAVKHFIKGYKVIKDISEKCKEIASKEEMVYYDENILLVSALEEVLNNLKLDVDDLKEIQIINRCVTKIGAMGYYAVKNHGYDERDFEGSPEKIYYYVINLRSDKLDCDDYVVSVEIDSLGKIRSMIENRVSTGCNIKSNYTVVV